MNRRIESSPRAGKEEEPLAEGAAAEAAKAVEATEGELVRKLASLAEQSDDLEKAIVEEPSRGEGQDAKEASFRSATLVGRVRDTLYKAARIVTVLFAIAGAAEGIETLGQAFGWGVSKDGSKKVGVSALHAEQARDPSGLTQEEAAAKRLFWPAIKYGSPAYVEVLSRIRAKLAAAGITEPSNIASPEGNHYFDFFDHNIADVLVLEHAIGNRDRELENKKVGAKEISEEDPEAWKAKDAMPDTKFKAILVSMNYESLLRETAYEFGVDPYRRLGYLRYEGFDRDIIDTTSSINKRIGAINKEKGKHYPLLSPGLLAAIALQEGVAKLIDQYGYRPDSRFNSYGDMGLDSLIEDLPRLEKAGLVASDLKHRLETEPSNSFETELFGRDRHRQDLIFQKNEAGMRARSVYAAPKDLLEGMAAIVAERRNLIIDTIGQSAWNKFGPEEQDWIIYAAHQWGQGNVLALLTRHEITTKQGKRIPITNYPKYKDGRVEGRVGDIHGFIRKDHGRNFRSETVKDFHATAAQVAVSAKVLEEFFERTR